MCWAVGKTEGIHVSTMKRKCMSRSDLPVILAAWLVLGSKGAQSTQVNTLGLYQ